MRPITDCPLRLARRLGAPLLIVSLASAGFAQPTRAEAERHAPRMRPIPRLEVLARFDADRSGRLERSERVAARSWLAEKRPRRSTGSGAAAAYRGPRPAPRTIAREGVATYRHEGFYDVDVVRTLFLDFADDDWSEELDAFFRTDVDVPATLTVDGRTYPGVGVHYRGTSSYFAISDAKKKSFGIAIDHTYETQRVRGYQTLNLLNGHADPSFMRTVLFSYIANHYVPVPKANFVHLVINGESWGLYINEQQLNKDFLAEGFHTRRGARWKVPLNFTGDAGLVYLGPEREPYESRYELKSASDEEAAWQRLIRLCEVLDRSSPQELASQLPAVLDIDATLWFLALGNVFMDSDGYQTRGSDYALYLHPSGRFHPLLRDNNESFNYHGGMMHGFGRAHTFDATLDPLYVPDLERAPLVSKVLAVPAWRARYLKNCRTLLDDWLDWDRIGPLIETWRRRIAPLVEADDKALYGYQAFLDAFAEGDASAPGLKAFFDARREYLSRYDALKPHD